MSQSIVQVVLLALGLVLPAAREEPPAATARYSLTVHVSLESETAEVVSIGTKQYLQPATFRLDATARFQIAQKLWPSGEGGNQEREVLVEEVETEPVEASAEREAVRLLQRSLKETFERWQQTKGQAYRSSRPAGSRVWPPALHLALDEEAPQYLTVWLDEALQAIPLANLPAEARAWSRERLALEIEERKSATEFLRRESVRGEPAEVELATFSLSGRKPSVDIAPTLRQQGVEVALTFHAEEQDTVSLEDGRLLRASRSASRETRWLVPQKSTARAPAFRARLACTVTIEELE